uniref:Uncharacterized protein n=1 Tax=Arundo donax TaxID=35708 RepID=A0A0A8ZIM3_ARUDO
MGAVDGHAGVEGEEQEAHKGGPWETHGTPTGRLVRLMIIIIG